MTRAILTPIGAFAIALLLALAACMIGDNGGGVPYYPDRPQIHIDQSGGALEPFVDDTAKPTTQGLTP